MTDDESCMYSQFNELKLNKDDLRECFRKYIPDGNRGFWTSLICRIADNGETYGVIDGCPDDAVRIRMVTGGFTIHYAVYAKYKDAKLMNYSEHWDFCWDGKTPVDKYMAEALNKIVFYWTYDCHVFYRDNNTYSITTSRRIKKKYADEVIAKAREFFNIKNRHNETKEVENV